MNDISSQTLHIVAKELAITLNDARAALEAYAERPDQSALLEKCADLLHSAHGALRLVEVYGAALLAEEMEHVTRYLLTSGHDQKRQIEGLDALMRSMVQLPTYLERVLSGGRDLALVLLPLLNDLRSVRGSPLLSEGTLLLLNLKSDAPAQPVAQHQGELLLVTQWARRLRPQFQLALLGYIRGARTVQNLEVLSKVAEKLEQIATSQPVFQLWWVVGAILEALRTNGLEGSATLKRLLGQADRQIKALYELGEARYGEDPPIDLLNNLLYYVARATTNGGRIAAVRASFKLAELLPVDDSIEHERESLSAPSVKLMRTVAAAIKEDLSKVKDVLDIFVRRGGGASDELAPQLELLKKISDTLGVLGLGELRQRVQQEIGELAEIVTEGKIPPEESLVRVAGVLLSVEDSLDDQLVRLILPAGAETDSLGATGLNKVAGPQDAEFRQVSEAVLRECIVNMARIKEAVTLAVAKPTDFAPQGLDNVPQLLRGITAGLLMLGKTRAVEVMEAIGNEVRKLVEPGAAAPDALRLERIADAMVSIEYYMETLQNGRSDPWYMLDNAEISLRALLEQSPRVPNIALPGATASTPIDPAAVAETVALDRVRRAHAQTHPLINLPQPEKVDPQFVELFIEEAKEEIASIQNSFPLWDQNPMDLESLNTIRRSFHTLKGSGRMVGARAIAEFAWSVENLLNRIIDKTLTRTPGMMGLLRSSVAALGPLVEQLETGRPATVPVESLMSRAFAYADGREADGATTVVAGEELALGSDAHPASRSWSQEPASRPADYQPTQVLLPQTPRVPEPPPAPPAAAPELTPLENSAAPLEASHAPMDPSLHDIYSKETSSHLEVIREYLDKRADQPAPHDLPEGVYRAIHTLTGSSMMADARHGIRITGPLNDVMRKVFDAGFGLSDEGLSVLDDAVRAIDNVVTHINESTGFFVDQPALLERLHQLEEEVDAELARLSAEESASQLLSDSSVSSLEAEPPAVLEVPAPEYEVPAPEFAAPAAEFEMPPPEEAPPDYAAAAFESPIHHDAFEPSLGPPSTEPVAAEPEPEPEPVAFEPAPPAPVAAEPEPHVMDFDREIADIYTEEATELFEAADGSLAAWNLDRRDAQAVASLQRTLHTLKGGARMAGIVAMGDLSHELEALVIQIENGGVAADDRAAHMLQASLDELARMRDQVAAGSLPGRATGLVAQIRALIGGQPHPVEASVPAPVAAAPAPVPAPPEPEPVAPESEYTPPEHESLSAVFEPQREPPEQEPAASYEPQPEHTPVDHEPAASYEPQPEHTPVDHEPAASYEPQPEHIPFDHEPGASYQPQPEPAPLDHEPAATDESQPAHTPVEDAPLDQLPPAAVPEPVFDAIPVGLEPVGAELEPAGGSVSVDAAPELAAPATPLITPAPDALIASEQHLPPEIASEPSLEPQQLEPFSADSLAGRELPPDSLAPQSLETQSLEPQSLEPQSLEPQSLEPWRLEPHSLEAERLEPQRVDEPGAESQSLDASALEQSIQPHSIPSMPAPEVPALPEATAEAPSVPVLPGREATAPVERTEMARVDADLLDTMLNNAGEVSIFRSRLDQQVNSIDFNLAELARTVTRLKEQLRGLEIETEAQIMNRHQEDHPRRDDFDPLELDRYSSLQQFSRALAETSGDVASIQGLLETLTREAQNLLTQQARVITELQNALMRTRMVPFQRHVQRLTRLVRQTANEAGKKAEVVVQGAGAELDRQMLERMVPPLEHMLRNAVVHGIETPERRINLGKPETGRISISLERDGAEVIISVDDDGGGINVKLIREKAAQLGLTDAHAKLTDEEAMQLILESGFSTAGHVTQAAGRGIGMDVVATEVKKLGGGLFIESTLNKGTRFTIRLPFTLAISQALIVRVADEVYALPLATVEGVVRLPRNIVMRHLGKDAPLFEYGSQKYRFQQLGSFVGLGPTRLPEGDVSMPVVLIRAGEHSTALVTDELVGSREIVVKSLGPQISAIRGIAGATVLGDGRIVIILDMGSLVRSEWRARAADIAVLDQRDRRTFALVVDDSITVRRVTQRLLERNGMRVLTAKDGVDAVSLLQENLPDIILLDIEMPRMDGYEVAAHVRNDARLKHIPIVMITSRVSEKHRARAIELGVDDYLGKPYQESQLLDAIEPLVHRRTAAAR